MLDLGTSHIDRKHPCCETYLHFRFVNVPPLTKFYFLQASIGQLQLEIAVLQEQKTTQLDKIDELRLDMKYRRESDTAMIATLQDQLSRQESDGIHTVQTAERRADAAERNLAEARSSMECLRDEMDKISRETNVPSAAHQEELSALVVRLREQEALVKSSAQRVDTIGKRYTEGDLVSGIFRAY